MKAHLLLRVKDIVHEESRAYGENLEDVRDEPGDIDCLYIKSDRLYQHNILRINYTTYHVNVVYTGPGCRNHCPRRLHFLFAHYFDVDASGGFESQRLDSVRLSPTYDVNSFCFLDPAQVLRGCHIIPAFSSGRLMDMMLYTGWRALREFVDDSAPLSRSVRDGDGFCKYYVNRYVVVGSVQRPRG